MTYDMTTSHGVEYYHDELSGRYVTENGEYDTHEAMIEGETESY
jgi:hypothetical protein